MESERESIQSETRTGRKVGKKRADTEDEQTDSLLPPMLTFLE